MSVGWIVGRSVGLSVVWSVCHNFLKGRKVTLKCYNRSTCLFFVCRHELLLFFIKKAFNEQVLWNNLSMLVLKNVKHMAINVGNPD